MEKPFLPNHQPDLKINLLEAAQEFQWVIDQHFDDPLGQQEAIDWSLAVLESGDRLLGGRQLIIHALEAYALNPPGGSFAFDRKELQLGNTWLRANYVGFVHFETIGSINLNSLCLDVDNVRVLRDESPNSAADELGAGRSLIVPVQSVETLLAA